MKTLLKLQKTKENFKNPVRILAHIQTESLWNDKFNEKQDNSKAQNAYIQKRQNKSQNRTETKPYTPTSSSELQIRNSLKLPRGRRNPHHSLSLSLCNKHFIQQPFQKSKKKSILAPVWKLKEDPDDVKELYPTRTACSQLYKETVPSGKIQLCKLSEQYFF